MSDFIINLSQVVRVFPLLFVALLVTALWFGLMSVLKFTAAIFSRNQDNQIAKSPAHFLGWVALIPLAVILSFVIHPTPLKFRQERRIAFERVEAAGGWDVIKKDCLLLTNQPGGYFVWFRRSTNYSDLPPALAALKPIEVRFFIDEKLHVPIVRIHVLGISDTDRTEPYFGFWIVCAPTSDDYKPNFDFGSRSFQGKSLLITNSVFEIY
jgi:hypothetical protein